MAGAQAAPQKSQKAANPSYNGITYQKDSADLGLGDFDPGDAPEGFRELGFGAELLRGIHGLGFDAPTPIQSEAIPVAREGRDIIGCAQTGTGENGLVRPARRSNAYKDGSGTRCLVLTPTRELAIQVSEQFHRLGKHPRNLVRRHLRRGGLRTAVPKPFRRTWDIVVATPGRLLDHLNRKSVHFRKLEILIIDEADRMLDMGFAEEITEILKRLPQKRQTMLFSATMPEKIQDLWRIERVNDPVQINISPPSTPAEGIHQRRLPHQHGEQTPRRAGHHRQIRPHQRSHLHENQGRGRCTVQFPGKRENFRSPKFTPTEASARESARLAGFRQGKHRNSRGDGHRFARHRRDGSSPTSSITTCPNIPRTTCTSAGRTARARPHRLRHDAHCRPVKITPVKNIERFIGKALPRVGIKGFARRHPPAKHRERTQAPARSAHRRALRTASQNAPPHRPVAPLVRNIHRTKITRSNRERS